MAQPARPELVFYSIDELVTDAARLGSGPYDKAGKWDLAMILDHLGKSMNAPWSTEQKPVPWPFSIGARMLIHRMAKRQFYPSFKFPAPKAMRPDPNISLHGAQTAFQSAAEKIKACSGPTISDTPFGTLPLDDFIKLQLLHGAHHLGFLKAS